MRYLSLGPLLLAASTVCSADAEGPGPGSYGFDWLQPDSAACQPVTEALLTQFRECEYRSDGAFGLRDPVHACRVSENIEYMIFDSEPACASNLDAMKANAP